VIRKKKKVRTVHAHKGEAKRVNSVGIANHDAMGDTYGNPKGVSLFASLAEIRNNFYKQMICAQMFRHNLRRLI